jgi:hypothetical protein
MPAPQIAISGQDATETFDETVGRLNDLNSADRRCLSFVSQGLQTASAIAKETALTPAAVTALIDRLETRGWVVGRLRVVESCPPSSPEANVGSSRYCVHPKNPSPAEPLASERI